MSDVMDSQGVTAPQPRDKGRLFSGLGTLAHLIGVAVVLAISVSEQGWGSGGLTARGAVVLTVFVAVPLALGVVGTLGRGTTASTSRWLACAMAVVVGAFLGVTGVLFLPAAALFAAGAVTGTKRPG